MGTSKLRVLILAVAIFGCADDDAGSTTSPVSGGAGAESATAGTPAAGASGAANTAGTRSAGRGGTTGSARGGSGAAGATGAAGAAGAMGSDESDAGAAGQSGSTEGGANRAVLKEGGIDKYIGTAKPSSMESGANGETTFTFDVADGPRCLRGDPYSMGIRNQNSEDLLIYLQGGGSCSSAVCSATTTAAARVPATGLMNPGDMQNPVASWNLVYVPYCDGSLHYGDKDHPMETPPRYHRGLRNLSAALDVGLANFAKPKRILLAGSSAGGLGTIYASALVRLLYPEAELFVFNDAGVGVSTPDGVRARLTRDEWGTEQLIPPSCPECKASPHSTPIISWTLKHDPGLRVSIFSAYEDTVIADTFLMIGGPAFKQALLDETGKVVMAHPERAKRFYIDGTKHTTAGNVHASIVNGVTVGQWLGFMLTSDERWTDTLQ